MRLLFIEQRLESDSDNEADGNEDDNEVQYEFKNSW
jgi:hypothetical protein